VKCHSFFAGDTFYHVVTLTFDPLTLNISYSSSVMSVRNLSEIEPSSDELLIIYLIFAQVISCCELDFSCTVHYFEM